MGELNDYVFLNKEEINKMISVWNSNQIVNEKQEFECLSTSKKFTLFVVGINRDPDDKLEYVVQEREFDPESKRFMYQYFLAESVGTEGPLVLTKNILLSPFTSMLIEETSRLIGQGSLVHLQLKHHEAMSKYKGVSELYAAACADPNYNKELFTRAANNYDTAIHIFRNLVYDAVMQYDGVRKELANELS